MISRYKTKGFVFKKEDRFESDRSFSVFTEDFGRIEVFAKAIRKINAKLRSGIDVFYFSEIEFVQGKKRKTLVGANKINSFSFDLPSLKIFMQVTKVLDGFIKGQEKDIELFNFLQEIFFVHKNFKNGELAYHYFVWNFLTLQGYGFEAYNCILCKEKLSPSGVYFSGRIGGIICEKCLLKDKDAKKLNADVVKILRIILKKDWQTLCRLKIDLPSQKLLEQVAETAVKEFCPS